MSEKTAKKSTTTAKRKTSPKKTSAKKKTTTPRKPRKASVKKKDAKVKVEFKEDKGGIVLEEAYVMRGNKVIDSAAMRRKSKKEKLMEDTHLSKEMTGSNQVDTKVEKTITVNDMVGTPYNPDILARFMDVDPVHYRCIATKVNDTIGGAYCLEALTEDDNTPEVKKDMQEVQDFLDDCNDLEDFQEMLRKVDMDQESVGYGVIEVVRSMDKKIRYLYHVPAPRVRALRGHRGFVERFYSSWTNETEGGTLPGQTDEIFYLPFGEKVLSPNRKKIDGTPERYNPKKDGDISKAVWNLKDRDDLNKELGTGKIARSANEIIIVKKSHSKTAYYGVPDFISAIGAIKGNLNIRDFFFQFFEHNAVPQYAVIVKGAHLKDDVKEMIQEYFSTHVKGQQHSTLVIPIPASAGANVEVKFERLSAEVKEGSFQETKKNNQKDTIVAHGMTPSIIGIIEGSSLGAGKGTAQNETYKNRIVTPRQGRWQRVMNMIFKVGLGITTVGLEFDDLDIGDKREQRENTLAFQKEGVLSRNEVRRICKLGKPIDGGDRYTITNGGALIFVDELSPEEQSRLKDEREKLLGEKMGANQVNTKVKQTGQVEGGNEKNE